MRYFTPEELKKDYKKEVAAQLSKLAGKNVKFNFAISVFRQYANKFGWGKDARILDLGTANGDFLAQLNSEGYFNLYAHDIDDYLPAERKKIVKEYKFAELSMEALPWPDNYFDVVTAWCVLPHVENPFYAAREVYRVLKAGGVFIFTTLHLSAKPSLVWFKKHGDFKSYRETNNHIALLPPAVVRKTIGKKFNIEGIEYFLNPKIFNGLSGYLRKQALRVFTNLKKRWAYNVAYIMKKP